MHALAEKNRLHISHDNNSTTLFTNHLSKHVSANAGLHEMNIKKAAKQSFNYLYLLN